MIMRKQDRQETELELLLRKFARLKKKGRIPVRLIGSVTVDAITTNERVAAQIRDPELGGSAFRVFDSGRRILKAKRNQADDFDFQMYGKRCCLSCESGEVSSGWNAIFEELLTNSQYFEELKRNLIPVEDWKIPCTIHIQKPDGTRESYQRGELSNQLSWDDANLSELFSTKERGILYIGGVWRSQLHRKLAESLEELKRLGWIICLDPGQFDSPREPMLPALRQALGAVDILFATPFTLLLMGLDEVRERDLQLLSEQAQSALDLVSTGQLRLSTQPPMVVLRQRFLSLEILISEPRRLIRLPPPVPIGRPIYTPVGLRSAFIAALFFHLCEQCADGAGNDRKPIALLQDCLYLASHDAIELHKDDLEAQDDLIISTVVTNIKDPVPLGEADMGIFGESEEIRNVRRLIARAANRDANVLITGETGTGKELVARAIHNLSERRQKELVIVDCGSIPAALAESEFFGHVKGAFTGADDEKKGCFEAADGGMIFLDEVGNTPLELQTKLLRFLEGHTFRRVGATQETTVDVRVIAATNEDLQLAVQKGSFREDLYYRLNVLEIQLPPLRERTSDIEDIAEHFLAEGLGVAPDQCGDLFTPGALMALKDRRWPGNVRQLRNVIERLLAGVAPGETPRFTREDIEKAIAGDESSGKGAAKNRLETPREPRDMEFLREIETKFDITLNEDEADLFMKYAARPERRFSYRSLTEDMGIKAYRIKAFKRKGILESINPKTGKKSKGGRSSVIVLTERMRQFLEEFRARDNPS